MEYLDIHAHIFPEQVAAKVIAQLEGYYKCKWHGTGVYDDLIESMDEAGVRRSNVFSCATRADQVEAVNTYLASVQAKFPDRFCSFGTIHPDYPHLKEELARLKSLGLRGLKIHPDFQQIRVDDPSMLKVYDLVGDTLPILFHIGDPCFDFSAPKRLAHVLDLMPGLRVIAAHLGGYRAWDEGKKYLVGRDIMLDTSSSIGFITPEEAKSIILAHGCERVLWGSDYPGTRHKQAIADLKSLGLTPEQEEMIFHKNAEKLLFPATSNT